MLGSESIVSKPKVRTLGTGEVVLRETNRGIMIEESVLTFIQANPSNVRVDGPLGPVGVVIASNPSWTAGRFSRVWAEIREWRDRPLLGRILAPGWTTGWEIIDADDATLGSWPAMGGAPRVGDRELGHLVRRPSETSWELKDFGRLVAWKHLKGAIEIHFEPAWPHHAVRLTAIGIALAESVRSGTLS
jgi:hypothetical protein